VINGIRGFNTTKPKVAIKHDPELFPCTSHRNLTLWKQNFYSDNDTEVIRWIRHYRMSWASGRHSCLGFWTFRVQISVLCRPL